MKKNFDLLSLLPTDIMKLIFPYLGYEHNSQALIALMKTCRRNYYLIKADENLKNYAPLLHQVRQFNSEKEEIAAILLRQREIEKSKLHSIKEDLYELRGKLIELQKGISFDDLLSLRKDILSQADSNFFRTTSYIRDNKIEFTIFAVFVLLLLMGALVMVLQILNLDSNLDNKKIESEYNAYINHPAYDVNDTKPLILRHSYHYFNENEKATNFAWAHHPSNCDRNLIGKFCEEFSFIFGEMRYKCSNSSINQIQNTRNECINLYNTWKNLDDQKNTLDSLCKDISAFPSATGLLFLIEIFRILYIRNKMASKKYLDLPVSYLTKEHAARFDSIKNKYKKEIANKKITTISDLAKFLKKLYYQIPPSPSNLLIECEQYIKNIEAILNSNKLIFNTDITDSRARTKLYNKINSFFEKSNIALKGNQGLNESVILDAEAGENSVLLRDIG